MANEIYFLTRSYSYDDDVVASTPGTSEGTNLPANAVDEKEASYWETADSVPARLAIDLGAAREITGLWFKHSNVSKYELYRSSNGVDYTQVGAEQDAQSSAVGYWILVPSTTYRYYRLDITEKVGVGNILIYELMLMNSLLTLDNDDLYPSQMVRRKVDRMGGTYELADGSITSYSGERHYEEVDLIYRNSPKSTRDALYSVFYEESNGSAIIRPKITLFLEADAFPGEIFQGVWENIDFPMTYTGSIIQAGFSGTFKFAEG